jgi:hypothetical protein
MMSAMMLACFFLKKRMMLACLLCNAARRAQVTSQRANGLEYVTTDRVIEVLKSFIGCCKLQHAVGMKKTEDHGRLDCAAT